MTIGLHLGTLVQQSRLRLELHLQSGMCARGCRPKRRECGWIGASGQIREDFAIAGPARQTSPRI